MRADRGLGGRGEDRLVELLGHLQPGRELDTGNRPISQVFLPAAAGQIAAGHAFDHDRLQFHRHDGTAADLVSFFRSDNGQRIDAGQMIRQHALQLFKPEVRELGQYLSLVRNRNRQDEIERGNAVGCNDEQLVVANRIAVPNLATVYEGQ